MLCSGIGCSTFLLNHPPRLINPTYLRRLFFWLPQNVHGEWRCCWSQCQRTVVIIVVMTTCCEVQDTTAGFLCSCEDVLLLSAIIGPVLTHMHCGAWQAGSPLTPDAAQIHAGWGYRSTGLNMQQVCPPKEIGSVSGYILGKSKRSSGMVLDYPC